MTITVTGADGIKVTFGGEGTVKAEVADVTVDGLTFGKFSPGGAMWTKETKAELAKLGIEVRRLVR